MFRRDYKKIQDQAADHINTAMSTAANAGLHWVICLWESPLTPQYVEKRVGYFEDIEEAERMKDYLADEYSKRNGFKFYIKTSYGDAEDGGLFDA